MNNKTPEDHGEKNDSVFTATGLLVVRVQGSNGSSTEPDKQSSGGQGAAAGVTGTQDQTHITQCVHCALLFRRESQLANRILSPSAADTAHCCGHHREILACLSRSRGGKAQCCSRLNVGAVLHISHLAAWGGCRGILKTCPDQLMCFTNAREPCCAGGPGLIR